MEPSCGWICNPAIVWLDEVAVGKILDRIEKPTRCPRFDPVFVSNNHPLFGPLSIMIIAEHSIVVGVTTVVWHWGARVEHRLAYKYTSSQLRFLRGFKDFEILDLEIWILKDG